MEPFHSTLSYSEQLKLFSKRKPEIQSINHFYQEDNGSQCSYCHKGLSYSWGLVSPNYEPYTYQTMMERGWRRCGTYYYKLDLQRSCCKQWTHRMDINQFKIKKDQKKTIKRMMTWVYEPIVQMKDQKTQTKQQKKHKHNDHKSKNQPQHIQSQNHNQKSQNQLKKITSTKLITQLCPKTQQFIINICKQLNTTIEPLLMDLIPKQKLNPQNEEKPWKIDFLEKLRSFPSKPQEKSDYYCNWGMLLYGMNKAKFVKEFQLLEFVKVIKETVQKVELSQDYKIVLERGGYLLIELREELKDYKQFEIIKEVKNDKSHDQKSDKMPVETHTKNQNPKMQIQLSNLEIKKRQSNQFQKLQPQYKDFKGELIITSDKITFGRIKVIVVEAEENNDSWKMYQRYCKQIHGKEEKGLSSYTNFLCQRALTFSKTQKVAKQQEEKYYLPAFDQQQKCQKKALVTGKVTKRQGCYHMKYYLDDKFIAIGVIDILPNGLSSVYFFYEPQYKQHRLGVFSSLIEIEYVRYMSLTFPEFKYYYLGFYIHDNQKMAYKGDYGPFQLLCPITYNFVTVDERVLGIINKIVRENDKNIRLAPQGMPKDPDMNFTTDLGQYIDKNIKLTYRKRPLKLKQINPQFYLPVLILLKSYLGVLGKELFEIFTFTF